MKKHIKQIQWTLIAMIIMVSVSGMSSCETIDNGDIDGFWIITQVDSLQQGTSHKIREQLKTWSFQANLARFFNYNEDTQKTPLMARFEQSNGNLILSEPFIYNRMEGDVLLTMDSTHYLRPHFINSLPDTFRIEKLNRNKMKIADDVVRLYFEKY